MRMRSSTGTFCAAQTTRIVLRSNLCSTDTPVFLSNLLWRGRALADADNDTPGVRSLLLYTTPKGVLHRTSWTTTAYDTGLLQECITKH
jgi:hypothetical protein